MNQPLFKPQIEANIISPCHYYIVLIQIRNETHIQINVNFYLTLIFQHFMLYIIIINHTIMLHVIVASYNVAMMLVCML